MRGRRTFPSSSALLVVCAALGLVMPTIQPALAQGGPPLVTDDPDTPGDGHWEINLASLGARMQRRWEVSAPDADINYGWGERVQLKLDVPWTFVRESGERWTSGLGTGNIGVKWRFVDADDAGFSMSTYPQYLSGWLASSKRRGIASTQREFFLPLEASTKAGEFDLDGEIGRNFVRNGGANQWIVGGIVGRACGEERECLLEVHETTAHHESQTLVNLGMHWKLSDSLILLGSAGREFGAHTEDQQRFVFYLGFQLLR